MITIRREQARDIPQIFEINTRAFETGAEARLVDKLREAETYIALVAESDGKIVGHIAFSALTLDDQPTDFVGLAPMAVAPEFQKQGIGSLLVKEGLKAAQDGGFAAVFVLGHAEYYPRFGFEVAKPLGFTCEYPVPDEYFMAMELISDALSGKRGLIKYGPEFAMV